MNTYVNRDNNTIIEFIPRKFILMKQNDRFTIKHLYKIGHRVSLCNMKFSIRFAPRSKAKLFIHIWLPLIHIENNNSSFSIGNKYKFIWNHYPSLKNALTK